MRNLRRIQHNGSSCPQRRSARFPSRDLETASRADLGWAKNRLYAVPHAATSGIADKRGDGSIPSSRGHLLIGERLARRLEGLAWVTIVGTVYFVLAVTALHFLRPDYNPTTRLLSDYAVGPYGYLMTSAWFALGLVSFALAFGIRDGVGPSRAKSAGSLLLGAAAVFGFLTGIFPPDLEGSPSTTTGALHLAVGSISFIAFFVAIFVNSWGFRTDPAWRSNYRASLALGFAAVIILALLPVFANAGWPGISQRAAIPVVSLWLLSTGNRLRSVARAKVPTETSVRSVA